MSVSRARQLVALVVPAGRKDHLGGWGVLRPPHLRAQRRPPPGYETLMAAVAAGRESRNVFWQTSRLGRNRRESARIRPTRCPSARHCSPSSRGPTCASPRRTRRRSMPPEMRPTSLPCFRRSACRSAGSTASVLGSLPIPAVERPLTKWVMTGTWAGGEPVHRPQGSKRVVDAEFTLLDEAVSAFEGSNRAAAPKPPAPAPTVAPQLPVHLAQARRRFVRSARRGRQALRTGRGVRVAPAVLRHTAERVHPQPDGLAVPVPDPATQSAHESCARKRERSSSSLCPQSDPTC